MQVGIFDLTPKKQKRGKKTKKSKKKLLSFLAISGIFIYFLCSITNYFSSVIVSTCYAKVQSATMSAVNNAVIEVMSQSVSYSDLMMVEKDSNGDIAMFETNSVLVNRLARETAKKTQQNLQKNNVLYVSMPIGQLTGIAFFSNIGPDFNIKVTPYESVNCFFMSEFEEAGINQTRHKIFLNVIADMRVILPGVDKTISTCTEVLVCESLLVGKVPQIYLSNEKIGQN
ncbi:MAG: sporulation protein YunB [Clostridia bacterium]|nr:sporulation protein YunB [Clostridia bacterium]